MQITNAQATELLTAASKAIYKATARFGRVLSPSDVSDISNTAFVKTLENYSPDRGTIEALMYTVSYTVATDFLRGRNYAGGSKESHLSDLSTEDDEGNTSEVDVEDRAPSALDLMMSGEIDAKLTIALSELTTAQASAIKADLDDDRALSGSERIGKMRAIEAMQSVSYRRARK